jgi:hypothetical protein
VRSGVDGEEGAAKAETDKPDSKITDRNANRNIFEFTKLLAWFGY